MRGMQAFVKARCNQCHQVQGHGENLGPDLTDVAKRYKGRKLLQQIIEPSSEINKKYLTHQFLMASGKRLSGVVVREDRRSVHVITNLLTPKAITRIRKRDIDERFPSKLSSMPQGMLDVLTKDEILDLVVFLEDGHHLLKHHHKK